MFSLTIFVICLRVASAANYLFDSTQAITTSQFSCLTAQNASNSGTLIARIYTSSGSVDQTGIQNMQNFAYLMNSPDAVYIEPCVSGSNCPSPQAQIDAAINAVAQAGFYPRTTFISVTQALWTSNITYNREFLTQLVWEGTKTFSLNQFQLGIYTNVQDWSAVFGDWSEYSSLPLWWNSAGGNDLVGFYKFAGWSLYDVAYRQYSTNQNICGVTINLNYQDYFST